MMDPWLVEWLDNEENRRTLRRLLEALEHVGSYGKIELVIHSGKIEQVIAQSSRKL